MIDDCTGFQDWSGYKLRVMILFFAHIYKQIRFSVGCLSRGLDREDNLVINRRISGMREGNPSL